MQDQRNNVIGDPTKLSQMQEQEPDWLEIALLHPHDPKEVDEIDYALIMDRLRHHFWKCPWQYQDWDHLNECANKGDDARALHYQGWSRHFRSDSGTAVQYFRNARKQCPWMEASVAFLSIQNVPGVLWDPEYGNRVYKNPQIQQDIFKHAQDGDSVAQFHAGYLWEHYLYDEKQAKEWYEKSARQGFPEAQVAIYELCGNDDDMLFQAAYQGYAFAMWRLGSFHRGRFYRNEDKDELVQELKWYHAGAQRGCIHAQLGLARTYCDKDGIYFDLNMAQHWISISQKNVHSQMQQHYLDAIKAKCAKMVDAVTDDMSLMKL